MQLLYFFLSGRCPHNFGLCAQHHHHDRTWLGLPRMHLCGGLGCFAGRRVTVPKRYFLSWRQYHHHHTSYIIHHTSYIIIHHTSVHIILIILIIIIILLLIIIVIAIITVIILIFPTPIHIILITTFFTSSLINAQVSSCAAL